MPTLEVPINPETLAWALRRARLDPDDLARAAGASVERVHAWIGGKARPTYRQAQKIAQRLRVSFGQLLLPPPARVEIPIPDLRRRADAPKEPSLELTETIYDALRKRDWWREYRGNRPLAFVGSVDWQEAAPEEVADAIRSYIPVQAIRVEAEDWDDFLRKLSKRAEEIGILVLRRGIVGSNTHLPLDPTEFSGFAIADPVAPIILVNMRDYQARRNFTFAHELAHIWVGQSALDDNHELEPDPELEKFCDRVAAELLVPEQQLRRMWSSDPREAAQNVARRFWVSVWVAARRAHDLGLISREEYQNLVGEYYKGLGKQKRKSSSGNFDHNLAAWNSPTFTNAVVAATIEGELTFKEAASLLNISLGAFVAYLEKRSSEVSY
ncbi:MAG: ImmA/IrrE family metallo-endopeptidase [Limnochordales bacterium]|nr:ImmA/IrrE family metallo-endopeptidase [Limnochordales bacterium]